MSEREKIVKDALAGVAEEMIKLGRLKSGHVLVHFQNGVPMKVEWRTVAEPIRRPARAG
ncbi:MAG TPA: hypothetical protein VML54_06925 [Candidatus Limnocylindrales bacterium]|nr:hypothetical protein [Candidatus Limnocylindrales bacterium]